MNSPKNLTREGSEIDELLVRVRDAGAVDDNLGAEDWSLSDKAIAEAKAKLLALKKQWKAEAYEAGRIAEAKTCEQARRHDREVVRREALGRSRRSNDSETMRRVALNLLDVTRGEG